MVWCTLVSPLPGCTAVSHLNLILQNKLRRCRLMRVKSAHTAAFTLGSLQQLTVLATNKTVKHKTSTAFAPQRMLIPTGRKNWDVKNRNHLCMIHECFADKWNREWNSSDLWWLLQPQSHTYPKYLLIKEKTLKYLHIFTLSGYNMRWRWQMTGTDRCIGYSSRCFCALKKHHQ